MFMKYLEGSYIGSGITNKEAEPHRIPAQYWERWQTDVVKARMCGWRERKVVDCETYLEYDENNNTKKCLSILGPIEDVRSLASQETRLWTVVCWGRGRMKIRWGLEDLLLYTSGRPLKSGKTLIGRSSTVLMP